MKSLQKFKSKIQFLLTDIDDTLTDEGLLGPEAYSALWQLSRSGIHVIPVTGRPAGWCEMIARQWPVAGVIGENGAFYFRYKEKKMLRNFAAKPAGAEEKLQQLRTKILSEVPGCEIASDQFCRLYDLAIDFCEDVPALEPSQVQKIVSIFHEAGAQAKVSSIHVNGWFGDHNKLTMALEFLKNEFALTPELAKVKCAFSGDSPNDEPMFAFFPHSFAVANIQNFISQLKFPPTYVSTGRGGRGFSEIASVILKNNK